MKTKQSIKIIFFIALAGFLFSGYLSAGELLAESCPVGGCSVLLGIPVCLYGFAMYSAILLLSLSAWVRAKE